VPPSSTQHGRVGEEGCPPPSTWHDRVGEEGVSPVFYSARPTRGGGECRTLLLGTRRSWGDLRLGRVEKIAADK